MKKLNLAELTPDPLTLAGIEANCKTITISGYVVSSDKNTISLSKNQTGRSFCEYPLSSVVAAFKSDEKSAEVTLLIKEDTQVRYISYGKVKDENCCCTKCDNSDIDVKEARPYKSIHPLLAALQLLEIELKNRTGSAFLSCGEKFSDCIRKGGNYDECRLKESTCLFNETYGPSIPSF